MKKKDSTFWNMLSSLTLITAVAGGLLGYTHRLTQEPIARAAKAGREKSNPTSHSEIRQLPIDEQCPYTVRNEYGETTAIVYPAKKRGYSRRSRCRMQQLHRVRWRNTHYRGFRSRWNDSGLSSPETSGNARIGRKNGRMVQN